jgi:hypothetical protein
MNFTPIRFISEKIEVCFDSPPLLEKKPGCPDGFSWRGISFIIVEILAEWHDYQRKGRMSKNMKPANAKIATAKGSWGVGQDYFRVRTNKQRIFDIYYDRAPQSVNHRKGAWFVYRELTEDQ